MTITFHRVNSARITKHAWLVSSTAAVPIESGHCIDSSWPGQRERTTDHATQITWECKTTPSSMSKVKEADDYGLEVAMANLGTHVV